MEHDIVYKVLTKIWTYLLRPVWPMPYLLDATFNVTGWSLQLRLKDRVERLHLKGYTGSIHHSFISWLNILNVFNKSLRHWDIEHCGIVSRINMQCLHCCISINGFHPYLYAHQTCSIRYCLQCHLKPRKWILILLYSYQHDLYDICFMKNNSLFPFF